tara:strand:- start:614 stop:886 length:273 start_codon:yes stop_codon:yes gene_type:complete
MQQRSDKMADTKASNDMGHIDQRVFKMAAMLDTSIRFHSDGLDLDEMEMNYVDVWLKKERDPLLVTILATMTGARDPNAEAGDEEASEAA